MGKSREKRRTEFCRNSGKSSRTSTSAKNVLKQGHSSKKGKKPLYFSGNMAASGFLSLLGLDRGGTVDGGGISFSSDGGD